MIIISAPSFLDRMAFWKPGDDAPTVGSHAGILLDKDVHVEGSDILFYNPYETHPLAVQRQRLPIFQYRKHILYLVETCRVVIIVGEPGCGKTTQVPQYLLEAGWADGGRSIACTQPRRVACVTLAHRVAEEQGVRIGDKVGYTIRWEDRTNSELTRLKYVTDGMLLQEIMSDPLLTKYSVIMVDEAHERSLHSDALLGLLKKVRTCMHRFVMRM